jgi:hypothetical protein
MTKAYSIEASVHKPIKEGYRVKVEMKEIGLFINGMIVYPPNEKHEDWKVLTPAANYGHRWVHTIEFDGKLPLWKEICSACIEAVKLYINSSSNEVAQNDCRDVVLEDIDDKPLDFSKVDIPF